MRHPPAPGRTLAPAAQPPGAQGVASSGAPGMALLQRRAWLAGVASLGWAAALGLPANPAVASDGAPRLAPWPALPLLDGRTLQPADWDGRAAIVVFWATWCGFCRRHNVHVDALHAALATDPALKGQPLRVLGASVDSDAATVRRYMASTGFRFPVTMDGPALRQRLSNRRMIPLTCVLDRQGRLLQAIPGEMSEADVMDLPRLALRSGS